MFEHDRNVLLGDQWLNDNIIYAAQQLLKLSVPNGHEIGGLQSPQYGRLLTFKPVVPREKYIQVLHVDGNHWITVSNIDVSQDAVANVIFVYDSLLLPEMSLKTKKQICSLAKLPNRTIVFDFVNVMSQPNLCDCGIYALANATELAYGHDPARCQWETTTMRKHLIECFESGHMQRFPILKERRLPLGRRVRTSFKEDLHCICRMPNDKSMAMIQCSSCTTWFMNMVNRSGSVMSASIFCVLLALNVTATYMTVQSYVWMYNGFVYVLINILH